MSKVSMEDKTIALLIQHLNGSRRSFSGQYKVAHDSTRSSDDVPISPSATFLRTVVLDTYPSETRVASAASSRSKRLSNTYALVRQSDGQTVPVHILWLFEKALLLHGRGREAATRRFMHIRKLKVVSTEEAMGAEVPCGELLARMKVSFALREEDGEEMVLPFDRFVSQLVVVPIQPQEYRPNHVYGIKAL